MIYADRFAGHPTVLGMMFDAGFDVPGLGSVDRSFHRVPREGCAVFLDAIRDLRGKGQSYQREAVFTTVHELGHVFNLWHRETPASFMASSPLAAPHSLSAYRFLEEHCHALRNVDDPHIHPGGKVFGERGHLGPSDDVNPWNASSPGRPLKLQIKLTRSDSWYFEPVELEVELHLQGNKAKSCRVPEELDPGYARFVIWIEEPDGTLRRYRPARYYYRHVRFRTITRRSPYKRDISIFGESGGYTFRCPGRHIVSVTFLLPDGTAVRSNEAPILIKSLTPGERSFEKIRSVLTHRAPARLLYHRSGTALPGAIQGLESLLGETQPTVLRSEIEYALGRYYASAAIGRSRTVRRRHSNRAQHYLSRALDREVLSQHRRDRGLEMLKQLSEN